MVQKIDEKNKNFSSRNLVEQQMNQQKIYEDSFNEQRKINKLAKKRQNSFKMNQKLTLEQINEN